MKLPEIKRRFRSRMARAKAVFKQMEAPLVIFAETHVVANLDRIHADPDYFSYSQSFRFYFALQEGDRIERDVRAQVLPAIYGRGSGYELHPLRSRAGRWAKSAWPMIHFDDLGLWQEFNGACKVSLGQGTAKLPEILSPRGVIQTPPEWQLAELAPPEVSEETLVEQRVGRGAQDVEVKVRTFTWQGVQLSPERPCLSFNFEGLPFPSDYPRMLFFAGDFLACPWHIDYRVVQPGKMVIMLPSMPKGDIKLDKAGAGTNHYRMVLVPNRNTLFMPNDQILVSIGQARG